MNNTLRCLSLAVFACGVFASHFCLGDEPKTPQGKDAEPVVFVAKAGTDKELFHKVETAVKNLEKQGVTLSVKGEALLCWDERAGAIRLEKEGDVRICAECEFLDSQAVFEDLCVVQPTELTISAVNTACLSNLWKLTSCKSLTLQNGISEGKDQKERPWKAEDLAFLLKMPQLEVLNFGANDDTAVDFGTVDSEVIRPHLTKEMIPNFRNLPHLQELRIGRMDCDAVADLAKVEFKSLDKLYIGRLTHSNPSKEYFLHTDTCKKIFAPLKEMGGLEELILGNVPCLDRGSIEAIEDMNLRRLELFGRVQDQMLPKKWADRLRKNNPEMILILHDLEQRENDGHHGAE